MPATRRLAPLSVLAIIVVSVLVAIGAARPAHAVTVTVTTTDDDNNVNGNCTFREAIQATNTNTDVDQCLGSGGGTGDAIIFDVGPGTPTINIGAVTLPHITEWVVINGNSGGSDRIELHGEGGIPVSQHHGLTVDTTGAGTLISSLVINNFPDDGIFIVADEVTVTNSFIGTDATGMTAIPNLGFGIQVAGNGDRIGSNISNCNGDDWCARNLISGNQKSNILLDVGETNSFVWGNFIGVDSTGMAALAGNNVQGIQVKGAGDTIGGVEGVTPGGTCTGECNLISGNAGNFDGAGYGGIVVQPVATGTRIWGNFIGTDVTGTQHVGQGDSGFATGILIKAPGVTVGGTVPEMRNVISGNFGDEIFVSSTNDVIQGNYLGTNSAGTESIPTSGAGVYVDMADGTLIGGTSAGARNVISGANSGTAYGVQILRSTNIQVVGNLIGVAANGSTPIGNASSGVIIFDQASNNIVGGGAAGSGNTIAFNGGDGVVIDGRVPDVRANAVRGNSIYSNGFEVNKGIELIPNANDEILPPVIIGIEPLTGTACSLCNVEIFSDAGNEGAIFEGSVFADVSGFWGFGGALTGPYITATATDVSNNTSEFSAPVPLEPRTQGNVNCDGFVNIDDFVLLLEYAAEVNDADVTATGLCPDLNDPDSIAGFPWGDLNCDGLVNALDALYLLMHLSGAADLPQGQGCTPIGQPITGQNPTAT